MDNDTDGGNVSNLAELIRDIPDFPVPGILFRDITTLLKDGKAFHTAIEQMTEKLRDLRVDKVIGIESRGVRFGAPIASTLGVAFGPLRKLGKLPADTVAAEYDREYGSNTVERHRDAIAVGERVVVGDDLM